MESTNQKKARIKRKYANFQTNYRRSSNFGYGSKRDRFIVEGDGELSVPNNINH
ncbi:hypothetical protein [Aquimarina addita]|uniref:hypothetical protein n=1 Tax=Aquimarina addita TaxID=870485 RepID=UPI0031E603B6